MPVLSIILPVWNNPNSVVRAVNSVVCSKGLPFLARYSNIPVELILINDGSNHHRIKSLLRDINTATRDGRANPFLTCKILEVGLNLGPGFARNLGISNSDAKYYCFLDSDELYFRYQIADAMKTIIDAEADILMSPYDAVLHKAFTNKDKAPDIISEWTINPLELEEFREDERKYLSTHIYRGLLGTFVSASCVNRCLEKFGEIFPTSIVRYEESVFLRRVASVANFFTYIPRSAGVSHMYLGFSQSIINRQFNAIGTELNTTHPDGNVGQYLDITN